MYIKFVKLQDQAWLTEHNERESVKEIAALAGGCTTAAVLYSFKKFGIKTRQRYPELNDVAWLRNRYVEERLSTSQISKLLHCNKNAVREALIRHDIPLRDVQIASKLRKEQVGLKSYRYDQLNDCGWLYDKYITEGLSTNEIARLVNVKTPNSVRQALQRAGIEVRSVSDGLTYKRVNGLPYSRTKAVDIHADNFVLDESVVCGGLLGDAGFRIHNKHSDFSYPSFYRKNKYRDHVEFVAKLLGDTYGARITEDKSRRLVAGGKIYGPYYVFRTLCHKELLPLYRKWYPEGSGFKKVIPSDIEINETVLLHWFLDDGSSSRRTRKYPSHWKQRKQQVKIVFCSESFTKEDQEVLCEKVAAKFPLTPRLQKVQWGAGYRIGLPQSETKQFFGIIGPPPVPSLAYKWKIPETIV